MASAADAIREALICPKCGRSGVVRARRIAQFDTGLSLEMSCGGLDGPKVCGILGTFIVEDSIEWARSLPADVVLALQRFLDGLEVPEEAVDMLAFAQRKNDQIAALENEIRRIAQLVHQSYHGGHAPDLNDHSWEDCAFAVCQRARDALGMVVLVSEPEASPP